MADTTGPQLGDTTMTSYYDSAEGETITKARAMRELDRHGICDDDRALFLSEMGDCETYDAQAVLAWLGY